MPYRIPSVCLDNVATLNEVVAATRNCHQAPSYRIEYKRLLKSYKVLCAGCNVVQSGILDTVWIERIREFLGHVDFFIRPLMLQNAYFNDCIQRMLCARQKCQNLMGWPIRLDRSFLNWICHKTSYMAFTLLDIDARHTTGLGAPGSDAMRNAIQTLVFDACTRASRRGLRQRVTKAYELFDLAYSTRCLRQNEPHPICSEDENGGHLYQKIMVSVFKDTCEYWLQVNNLV